MLTREAFEALLDACMKSEELGELVPFLRRRSMKELKEDMLPGLRSLSKIERLLLSSAKLPRVGDSVEMAGSARCRSLDSKNGMLSSNESDFGRGIAPLTRLESKPREMNGRSKKSMASFRPPALLRV